MVDCLRCKYFYVAWDKNRPRGCRFFGFKSFQIPAKIVKKHSGKECYGFVLKQKK